MKTSVTPFVLSEHESSRLASCEDKEISIVLGDDAYHNLRISLQHAKLLLAGGVYDRIYYINLPFSGKRFSENYKTAHISDDKRLEIYHVSNGCLADTIREIRQRMEHKGEMGNAAIIINSWEMGSRSYRHREDLIFAIYTMHMLSEATFFVYSVAEAKQIIMRRSSRAGFGKLVMISDGLVDLATGKYRIGSKEEKEKLIYLCDAVHYPEGPERDDFMRRHDEQQKRLRAEEEAKNISTNDAEELDAELVENEPVMVGPDGVCVNLDDSKINELPIEVGEEEEVEEDEEELMYSMAA